LIQLSDHVTPLVNQPRSLFTVKPRLSAGLGLLVISGLLGGCAKKVERDYQPLYVGGYWEFAAETSKPARGQEDQVRTGTEICRCVGMQKIGGQDYFKVVTFFQGFPEMSESVTWYRRASDGIYRIDGKTDNPERLFLPLPPKAGYSWTVEEPSGKSVGTIEVGAAVDLPNRSYADCITLHMENSDTRGKTTSKSTIYFARGVGVVKGEMEFGDVRLKLRLNKCSLDRP
jgi:hypothetical protein